MKPFLPTLALLLGSSAPVLACSCMGPSHHDARASFREIHVRAHGRIEDIEPSPFGGREPVVWVRVSKGLKGAAEGDIVRMSYETSNCGNDKLPEIGEGVSLTGYVRGGTVEEAICFNYGDRDEFARLMDAYPAVRDGRLARARGIGTPAAWAETIALLLADGDPLAAREAIASAPLDGATRSILSAKAALAMRQPAEAVEFARSLGSGSRDASLILEEARRAMTGTNRP